MKKVKVFETIMTIGIVSSAFDMILEFIRGNAHKGLDSFVAMWGLTICLVIHHKINEINELRKEIKRLESKND